MVPLQLHCAKLGRLEDEGLTALLIAWTPSTSCPRLEAVHTPRLLFEVVNPKCDPVVVDIVSIYTAQAGWLQMSFHSSSPINYKVGCTEVGEHWIGDYP